MCFAGQVHEDIFLMFTQINNFPPVILRSLQLRKSKLFLLLIFLLSVDASAGILHLAQSAVSKHKLFRPVTGIFYEPL